MRAFEDALAAELVALLRVGATPRAVRLTVREVVVQRLVSTPAGPAEAGLTAAAAARAACRLVRERSAPEALVEAVCRAALEAVRGHGGETARWLGDASRSVEAVLDELAREQAQEPAWGWLVRRHDQW